MAITIISEQAAGIGRKFVRLQMDDGYVFFLKVTNTSTAAEVIEKSKDVHEKIKNTNLKIKRKEKIEARIKEKVTLLAIEGIAANEIDAEDNN